MLEFFKADAFLQIISTFGALTSVVSFFTTLVFFLIERRSAAIKLRAIQELEFRKVLDVPDIQKLGNYLETKLGNFTIDEYCRNKTIEGRVERILGEARRFLGNKPVSTDETPEQPVISENEYEPLPSEFEAVKYELNRGETWNALARLRHEIEKLLRKKAEEYKLHPRTTRSAGQMVRELANRDILNPEATKQLLFAIDIANRAIHGQDVLEKDVESAIKLAAVAVRSISKQ